MSPCVVGRLHIKYVSLMEENLLEETKTCQENFSGFKEWKKYNFMFFSIFPFHFFLCLIYFSSGTLFITADTHTLTHTHTHTDWRIELKLQLSVKAQFSLTLHYRPITVEVLWGSAPLWNRGHIKVSSTPDHTWTLDWALLLTEFLWGFSAYVFLRNGSALFNLIPTPTTPLSNVFEIHCTLLTIVGSTDTERAAEWV